MRRILWPLRIFHIAIIVYYIAILPLAAIGYLAKYSLWNNLNLSLTLFILFLQATWGCPLTKIESSILKKDKKGFAKRCFRRLGINIPHIVLTVIQALTMILIVVFYLVYS